MVNQDTENEYTVRAPRYAVIQGSQVCWRGKHETPVFGLLVPAEHEQLWVDDDPDLDEWERPDSASIVSHVSRLPATVLARLQAASPHYRMGSSRAAGEYFVNHCARCGAIQGDHFLYGEPDGAFFLMSEGEVQATRATAIDEPFACRGDPSYSSLIDLLAQRVWPA